MRSSTFSMPTESRSMFGYTPAATCSASLSWECVVDAGCTIRDLASPTLPTWSISSSLSTNAAAASKPPFTLKVSTPPKPLRKYFLARALYGLLAP